MPRDTYARYSSPMTSLAQQTPRYVAAGSFGSWLAQTRAALQGDAGVDVPCGDCVGCCVSSYPIPLRAADTRALEEVPIEFFARTPNGQAMMVAREDGTCPMLTARKCSIYEARPQTCRDYDCRVFAAAGIDAGGPARSVINRRVHEWQFSYSNDTERATQGAVRAAAAFIRDKGHAFPGLMPSTPTGIAVLAIKVYTVFLVQEIHERSDQEVVRAIIETSRQFDASCK